MDQLSTDQAFKNYVKENKSSKSNKSAYSDFLGQIVGSVGVLKYDSGEIYEGQLLNGKRSGNGKIMFSNGDSYRGMWKNDMMCDPEGIYIFKNGNQYKGGFNTCSRSLSKFGVFEGAGTLKIDGLGIFTGMFQNNMVNGAGKFIHINSNKQEPITGIWTNMKVDDLIRELGKI
mmetsp:Transcript_4967/g.8470  ORF Transcript_4967/g.8470 Transcript_4967/m.8470 type:complete len:173 (-) Transcript_4967:84-602(-)